MGKVPALDAQTAFGPRQLTRVEYAREPAVKPSPLLPDSLAEVAVDVTGTLQTKLYAYATQFGGEEATRRTLAGFAAAEARRLGSPAGSAKALLVPETPGQPGVARLPRAGSPV